MTKNNSREGWTLLESVVALACLTLAATLVTQLAAWSLSERVRADVRLATMEWAANVLETARAKPWSELTPEWGIQQKLAPYLVERMVNPTVRVIVEPEKDRPRLKRISVAVQWFHSEGAKAPPVELMTLIADRPASERP